MMRRRNNIAAPATAPGSGDQRSEFQQQLRRHKRVGPYILLLLITIQIYYRIGYYYLNSLHDDGSKDSTERNTVAENDIESCLRPKKYPIDVRDTLIPPFINLGMPKMGSSSLHSYFDCGGYKSVHWLCGGRYCGDCIQEAIQSGLPPFSSQDPKCKISNISSYAQIDRGPENLVQVNYLGEIMSGVPNATFILTFRNMTKWYISMSRWWTDSNEVPFKSTKDNSMRKRFEVANIIGLPKGVGRNVSEFSQFYCEYVKRVRKEVAKYPGRHKLIEIDIEDPSVGWQMEDFFGVNRTCWGISNAANHNDTIPTEQLQR